MSLKNLLISCIFVSLIMQIHMAKAKTYTKEEFEQVRQQFRQSYAANPKEALELINRFLTDPDLTTEQQLVCLNYKSWFHIEIDELKEATRTIVQYQALADKHGDPRFIYGYNNMYAGLYTRIENFDAALSHHVKAQSLAKSLKPQLKYQTEQNIAMLYTKLGRLEEAIDMFQRYVTYLKQFDRPLDLALVLVNLAETQADLKQYLKAHETLNQAISIQEKHNFARYLASSYLILGRINREQGNLQDSTSYLHKAIKIFEELSIIDEATKAYISLAKSYQQIGDAEKVNALLESALLNTEQHQLPTLQAEVFQFAASVYEKRNDLEQALKYFQAYHLKHDKILQQRAEINLAKAIAQSDITSKELEISELTKSKQLKLAKAKSFQLLATTVSIGLFVLTVGAMAAIRRINRSNRKLRQTLNELTATQHKLVETEKVASLTSLASGMAHQLNTPIGTIVTAGSLIDDRLEELKQQLASKTLKQSSLRQYIDTTVETRELIQTSTDRLIAMVDQFKALNVSLSANQSISKFYLEDVIQESIKMCNGYLGKIIHFEVNTNGLKINTNYQVLVDVLVNLITNSLEHGFKQQNGKIQISAELYNGVITISYEDNGIGIKPELLKDIFTPFFSTNLGGNHLGLGLNVVFNAVKYQLQGDITALPSDQGACFVVTLPESLLA